MHEFLKGISELAWKTNYSFCNLFYMLINNNNNKYYIKNLDNRNENDGNNNKGDNDVPNTLSDRINLMKTVIMILLSVMIM